MALTGVRGLDALLEPVGRGWTVEVYGPWRVVEPVVERAVVEQALHGRVAVVHVQDFGGLNPYSILRLARLRGASPDNILVARAFRARDVPVLVREAVHSGARSIVVVRPYYYAPRTPREYQRLTPVTGALRWASGRVERLLLFNTPTRLGGGYLPEGGNYHHHSVHVIARLTPTRRGAALATLLKHPARPTPRHALVHKWDLEPGVSLAWAGQRPLLEYL